MAKAKITHTKNGATFIYQKDPTIRGNKFTIAFRGGSQFDGDYPGLSHLIEHLIFRDLSEEKSHALYSKTMEKCLNMGAYTSSQAIAVYFSASQEDSEKMIQTFMKRLLNRNFTQEQILKEIDVISHEIEFSGDDDPGDEPISDDYIINSLQANKNKSMSSSEILGNYKKMKKYITPEVITDYIKKYFTEANLMVSVVSNDTYEDALTFFEKNILSKVNMTRNPQSIAGYPQRIYFRPANVLAIEPDAYTSGATVQLYLRERLFDYSNVEFELACDAIETNIMAEIGGVLWNNFRLKEQLAYIIQHTNLDLGTAKFKVFTINTSGSKVNKVIKKLCEIIKDIAENGVDKKMFYGIQKGLVEGKASKLYQKRKPDALENFENYLGGYHIVDADKVSYYIKNMTYEQFCEQIKKIYAYAQPSLHVTGDFDSRKCYNLIEIEEMLGNKTHSEEKEVLNVPRYEVTRVPLTDEEEQQWNEIAEENGIDLGGDDEIDFEGDAD